jgi:U3 small nucleolar RNA-associated protein 15
LIPSPTSYPVTHISFPPPPSNPLVANTNDYFTVTTGTRVQIFSIRTRKLVKTITRFGDIAHSGEIRRDGRVLVAGDDSGKIQVFDVNSRAILKTWEEHKQPVWSTKFSPTELTTLLSASDDRTVRLWDLPSGTSTHKFIGHEDYVRTASFMPGMLSQTLVSGSYDSTVKIWDPRAPQSAVMTFKHAAPIESVLPMPSGTTLLASSEAQISVLDLVAGKPLHLLKNHQKTVTALCLASNGTRLLSGSLDGHMKVFETTGWNCVAGSKYASPILSLCVVPSGPEREDKHLAVGLQSGILSIKTRLSGAAKVKAKEREKEMAALIAGEIETYDKKRKRKSGIEKRDRGMKFMGEGADVVIEGNERRNKGETKWEKLLRHAEYAEALDVVLSKPEPPVTVLTMFTAMKHRSALKAALAGRTEETVLPVLKWVTKYVIDPRYVSTCVDAAMMLVELYGEFVGGSEELEKCVRMLHRRVRTEVERAQAASQTGGMVGLLLAGRGVAA